MQQELFTSETRPQSVRQLYKESGKEQTLLPLSALATPSRSVSVSFNGDLQPPSSDDMLDGTQDADELLLQCSDSDFGNANRKLRTRIDAEIEIRLVSCLFHAFIMYIKTKYIKATLKLAKKPNSNHSSMCVVSAVAVRAVASCNEPAVALYDFVVVVKRVGAAVKRDHTHKWAEASVAASAANELKSSRVQFS